MLREWSHPEIVRLIELWSEEQCLFNARHPDYHKKDRRNNALTRLKETLDNEEIFINLDDIISKIHSLRVYYSSQRSKRDQSVKSGAGADDVYKIKWQYFNRLEFLNNNLQPRKTVSNLSTYSPPVSPSVCSGGAPPNSKISKQQRKKQR